MARRTAFFCRHCCGVLTIVIVGVASLILSRLSRGFDLWHIGPVQGGVGEWLWSTVHWIGVRNLAPLVAFVPGYRRVHFAAAPSPRGASPRIALTFDDAVGKNSTGIVELLDILEGFQANCTFFTIASDWTFGEGRPQILREISERGHEVGNHGLLDESMYSMSVEETEEALDEWERRVLPVLTKWPQREGDSKWFRAPQARMNSQLEQALSHRGYHNVLADVYSDDWLIHDAEYHRRIIEGLAADGSVVVLHVPDRPARMQTLEIVRAVIPSLQARGFRFVRVSDLFGPEPSEAGAPRSEVFAFFVGAVGFMLLLLLRDQVHGACVCMFPMLRSGVRTQQEMMTVLRNPILDDS